MELVKCNKLCKEFDNKKILKDVNLIIPKGRIIGLLGKNGMGKTTLLKLINDLLTPTSGEVLINGKKPNIDSKKAISYLPERTYLDKSMKVSQIITFGTLSAKSVIRDVGRVLDVPYSDVDKIAKMIPFEIHMTIDKALEENRELREQYENDETTKQIIDIAKGLEGMPRNASTHACRSCYNQRSSRYLCTTLYK